MRWLSIVILAATTAAAALVVATGARDTVSLAASRSGSGEATVETLAPDREPTLAPRVREAPVVPPGPPDVVTRLRSGAIRGSEALLTLRRLSHAQLRELDLGALLGPLVATGDTRTLCELRDIRLQPRDVEALDRVVLDGVEAGEVDVRAVNLFLFGTRRAMWPEQQALLEEGFRRGGRALETCALAMSRLGRQVPSEFVRWVLDTYQVSDATRGKLGARIAR